MTKCPGQDMQQWKFDAIFDVKCTNCGYLVEFYKDETKRKCPKCKEIVLNDRIDFGCAKWCPYAESCVGPEQYKNIALSEKLKKRREDFSYLLEIAGNNNNDVRDLFKKLYTQNDNDDVLFDTKRLYFYKDTDKELFDKATAIFNEFLKEKTKHEQREAESRARTEEMIKKKLKASPKLKKKLKASPKLKKKLKASPK